ncbi:MAG: hypothetical protein Q6373_019610, partial [Candidatus Sigynarchaeota archaeon]
SVVSPQPRTSTTSKEKGDPGVGPLGMTCAIAAGVVFVAARGDGAPAIPQRHASSNNRANPFA